MLKPSRLKRFWLSVGALVAFCCVKRAFRGLTCLSLLGLSASLVQIHVPNRKILTKTWGFY